MTMMKVIICSLLALVGLLKIAATQQVSTTILTLPPRAIGGGDGASVIEATPQGATTLKLGCFDYLVEVCASQHATATAMLTLGPNAYHLDYNDPHDTGTQDCNTKASTCAETFRAHRGGTTIWTTKTKYAETDMRPLYITAGAEKLEGRTLPQVPSPIVTIPFYGYGTQAMIGSVINATAQGVTTYGLQCADSEYVSGYCGFEESQNLAIGPSTYHMYVTNTYTDYSFEEGYDCNTAASTCVLSYTDAHHAGKETSTYESGDVVTLPVTIVSGGEKLESWPTPLASATSAAIASPTGSSNDTAKPGAHGPSAPSSTSDASQDGQSGSAAMPSPKLAPWTMGIFVALAVVIGY